MSNSMEDAFAKFENEKGEIGKMISKSHSKLQKRKGETNNFKSRNNKDSKKMNVGYMFNKEYFSHLNKKIQHNKSISDINKSILEFSISNEDVVVDTNGDDLNTFELKTNYPGLTTGIGYSHDIEEKDAFKVGFFFDYTSGLPVIQSSTIKGTIRSIFDRFTRLNNIEDTNEIEKVELEGINEYFKQLLCEKGNLCDINLNSKVNKIKNEVFNGVDINGRKIPLYSRDIFFDAILNIDKNKNKKILEDDYITPHNNDLLKNPIPSKFLKVGPDVFFQFRFKLNDGIIDKEKKLEIFKQIIIDLGIGAKTSVGYGYLVE